MPSGGNPARQTQWLNMLTGLTKPAVHKDLWKTEKKGYIKHNGRHEERPFSLVGEQEESSVAKHTI